MISQELMLGDWVMLYPDLKGFYPFAGKPCRVIGLNDDDGAIKIEYDDGKYFWTDAEDDVVAIPLTPEILEKNGFEGKGYMLLKIDSNSWLEYYNYEHRLKKFWRGVDEWQNHSQVKDVTFQCRCYYVHELQHALQLCGIDKTIEL